MPETAPFEMAFQFPIRKAAGRKGQKQGVTSIAPSPWSCCCCFFLLDFFLRSCYFLLAFCLCSPCGQSITWNDQRPSEVARAELGLQRPAALAFFLSPHFSILYKLSPSHNEQPQLKICTLDSKVLLGERSNVGKV